jgi:lysophospholipase L1-like esterase
MATERSAQKQESKPLANNAEGRPRGAATRRALRSGPTALLMLLLCAVSLEIAARAFWRVTRGIPLLRPDRILYSQYPEMRGADEQPARRGGDVFDVLLLGGSSLHMSWGQVQPALREQLALGGHKNVRIYNLAMPGQTSQDSRIKYALLGRGRYDLVIVYDGINDTRTNNAPPDVFRADYGHYGWYELVNGLAPYHGRARFALPYTLRRIAIGVRQAARASRYVAIDSLQKDWIQYGSTVRSAATFERNLRDIIAIARSRGDPLLLMTFASHVPANYSLEAFNAKQLDYGLHLTPIEAWGSREHVTAGVAAHNAIIRRLAAQHPGVRLVDQATLMQGAPQYFNDVCHFTIAGAVKFAENIRRALVPPLPVDSAAARDSALARRQKAR